MSDLATAATAELAFGPRHPAMQGMLRLRLTLDGDTVVDCRPLIGYGHRGLEKLFEGYSLRDNVALTDRLDFVAAAAANIAYAGAVERLLGLDAPPRARYLRVVLAELQRLASHLLWLGTFAEDAGVPALLAPCLHRREQVLDLLAAYCGARLTLRCALPGGMPRDAPDGWLAACGQLAAAAPAWVDGWEAALAADRIFRNRTVGLGLLAPETAIALGVTGPCLRASGVDFDLRRALPYDAYDALDVEVPLRQNGDAYDRCLVRLADMRQAALLVTQAVERMPAGPVGPAAAPPDEAPPDETAPAGAWQDEVYFAVEGPRGELGFYVAVAGRAAGAAAPSLDEAPRRCHVRSPSLFCLQALPEMARGHEVGELVVLLGSLDLALGEVDR